MIHNQGLVEQVCLRYKSWEKNSKKHCIGLFIVEILEGTLFMRCAIVRLASPQKDFGTFF